MLKPFLAITLLAAGPALAQDADTVVATVNGETITLGQMIAMRSGITDPASVAMPDAALWDLMLDQMIRQTAVGQPRAEKLTPRDEALLELDRRAYLAGAALETVAAADPSEDELRIIYDRIFGAEDGPRTEYHAAHILVGTEDEAKAIVAELEEGADFGTLAEEKSTDNSAPNKGDLGWFQPEQMVEPFAEAIRQLEPDSISAPVETQFGWHVIRLMEVREMQAPQYDEIRDELAVQVRRERVEAEIQERVSTATIEKTEGLDPALLRKTELLER